MAAAVLLALGGTLIAASSAIAAVPGRSSRWQLSRSATWQRESVEVTGGSAARPWR
jgi:hypothetical protein